MADVPCNGCTACCHGPVILHPALDDDPRLFDCEFVPQVGYRLKRKPNGDCTYLTDKGCAIWPNTPGVCRAFDCRKYVLLQLNDPLKDSRVVAAGKRLLAQEARANG